MQSMTLRSGYYGKIPGEADYVAAKAGTQAEEKLLAWLFECNDYIKITGSIRSPSQRTYGYIFNFNDGYIIRGCIKNSQDSHNREFPFTCYTISDAGTDYEKSSQQIIAGLDTCIQMENSLMRAKSISDISAIIIDESDNKHHTVVDDILAGWQESDFASNTGKLISGDYYAYKESVLSIIDRIIECGIELCDKGIRIVTFLSEDYCGLIFWVNVVERRIGNERCQCHYLWSKSDEGYMDIYVFFNFPSSSLLKYLFDTSQRSDMIIDVDSHNNGYVATGAIDRRSESLLDTI